MHFHYSYFDDSDSLSSCAVGKETPHKASGRKEEEKGQEHQSHGQVNKKVLTIDKSKEGANKKDTTGNITMETPRHSQPPFQASRKSTQVIGNIVFMLERERERERGRGREREREMQIYC